MELGLKIGAVFSLADNGVELDDNIKTEEGNGNVTETEYSEMTIDPPSYADALKRPECAQTNWCSDSNKDTDMFVDVYRVRDNENENGGKGVMVLTSPFLDAKTGMLKQEPITTTGYGVNVVHNIKLELNESTDSVPSDFDPETPPDLSMEASSGLMRSPDSSERMAPPVLFPEITVTQTVTRKSDLTRTDPIKRKKFSIAPSYIVLTDVYPYTHPSSSVSYRGFKRVYAECSNMCKKQHFTRRLNAGKDVFNVRTPGKQKDYPFFVMNHAWKERMKLKEMKKKVPKKLSLLSLLKQQDDKLARKKVGQGKKLVSRVRRLVRHVPNDFDTELIQPSDNTDEERLSEEIENEIEEEQRQVDLERERKRTLDKLKRQIHLKRKENMTGKRLRLAQMTEAPKYLESGVSNISGRIRKTNSKYGSEFALTKSEMTKYITYNTFRHRIKSFNKRSKMLERMRLETLKRKEEQMNKQKKKQNNFKFDVIIDNPEECQEQNVEVNDPKKTIKKIRAIETTEHKLLKRARERANRLDRKEAIEMISRYKGVNTGYGKDEIKKMINVIRARKKDIGQDGVIIQGMPNQQSVIAQMLESDTAVGRPESRTTHYETKDDPFAFAKAIMKTCIDNKANTVVEQLLNKQNTPTHTSGTEKVHVGDKLENSASQIEQDKYKKLRIPESVQKLFKVKTEPGLPIVTDVQSGPTSPTNTLQTTTSPIFINFTKPLNTSETDLGRLNVAMPMLASLGKPSSQRGLISPSFDSPNSLSAENEPQSTVMKSIIPFNKPSTEPSTKPLILPKTPMRMAANQPQNIAVQVQGNSKQIRYIYAPGKTPIGSLGQQYPDMVYQGSVSVNNHEKSKMKSVYPPTLQSQPQQVFKTTSDGNKLIVTVPPTTIDNKLAEVDTKALTVLEILKKKQEQAKKQLLQNATRSSTVTTVTNYATTKLHPVNRQLLQNATRSNTVTTVTNSSTTTLRPVSVPAKMAASAIQSSQGAALVGGNEKTKFYLLNVDGKNILIPIQGQTAQPRAYVVKNDPTAPVPQLPVVPAKIPAQPIVNVTTNPPVAPVPLKTGFAFKTNQNITTVYPTEKPTAAVSPNVKPLASQVPSSAILPSVVQQLAQSAPIISTAKSNEQHFTTVRLSNVSNTHQVISNNGRPTDGHVRLVQVKALANPTNVSSVSDTKTGEKPKTFDSQCQITTFVKSGNEAGTVYSDVGHDYNAPSTKPTDSVVKPKETDIKHSGDEVLSENKDKDVSDSATTSSDSKDKPLAFAEGITAREGRLQRLKALLKEKQKAVDDMRSNKPSAAN